MKPGEPIGKWFIENLSITEDSELEIIFRQFGVSYSDGNNTYYLGGNTLDKSAISTHILNIFYPKVNNF